MAPPAPLALLLALAGPAAATPPPAEAAQIDATIAGLERAVPDAPDPPRWAKLILLLAQLHWEKSRIAAIASPDRLATNPDLKAAIRLYEQLAADSGCPERNPVRGRSLQDDDERAGALPGTVSTPPGGPLVSVDPADAGTLGLRC